MDRMVYLAMTGAKHALEAQQNTSNNLANAQTPGFRADLDSILSRPVQGPGYPSRVYSEETRMGSDFTQGQIMETGRELDVAVNGSGWLTVQASDGTEAYTRRGDLRITSGGLLETGDGHMVMGNNGPIAVPPAQKIEVGGDGTISIVPVGQPANAMVQVDRIRLVDPAQNTLQKGEDGLFRLRGGGNAAASAQVKLTSGALEGSNVNTVDALVQLIDNQRRYEAQVKLMQNARKNDENSQRLLRTSG
ncbi:MAG: flagellar basal-body rod protein FlgF [Ectothiorhodospiraceae bacterium]|jgi:flagellar basal-body rod protein FlgF